MSNVTKEKMEALEIDLQKLFFACLAKWWLILLCAVTAIVATALFTAKMITPMYQSTVILYVNNASNYEQVNYISSSNLDASQQLVNTYIGIIKTDSVLDQVAQKVGGGLTAGAVRGCLSAKQVSETVLFNVVITHPDPVMALRMAQAVAEVVPGELSAIVEGSSTKVVDEPKLASAPSSPSMKRNCMLGGLLGCMFAVVIIALMHLLDVRIRKEEDLESIFDYPVLGQVPAFAGNNVESAQKIKRAGRKGKPGKGANA